MTIRATLDRLHPDGEGLATRLAKAIREDLVQELRAHADKCALNAAIGYEHAPDQVGAGVQLAADFIDEMSDGEP